MKIRSKKALNNKDVQESDEEPSWKQLEAGLMRPGVPRRGGGAMTDRGSEKLSGPLMSFRGTRGI